MYKRRFSPDFRPVNSGKYFEGNEKYPTTDSETDEDVDEQIRFFSDEESLANGAMISSPKRASPLLLKRNFSQIFDPLQWDLAPYCSSSSSKRLRFAVSPEAEHFLLPRHSSGSTRIAWLALPEELLAMVFLTLDDAEISRISGVCSMWRRLAQTDGMYRHRCFLRWGSTLSMTAVEGHSVSWQQLYTKRCSLLSNFVICSTFFKQADKAEFKRKVVSLGGTYNDHFTSNVTHLIASRVGSCKYQLAMRLGLPVVTHEWLEQCYETSSVPADLSFRLLPLSGCCITVTGLSQADRSIVEQTARMFGAEFSPDLRRNRTTHLIAASARGAKYDAAVRWGDILVVRPKWFFDSIVKAVCMREDSYTLNASGTESDTETSPTS